MADGLNNRVVLANSTDLSERMIFEATPELVETRNVNYKTIDPVHAPGQIFAYTNSTARTFNISAIKLISRTQEEAERNLTYLWLLRAWTMPEFGQGGLRDGQRRRRRGVARQLDDPTVTADRRRALLERIRENPDWYGSTLLGQPPAVLYLSAYSPAGQDYSKKAHIHRVPVVIQNLSIPYPADTDYIPTALTHVPMPTIMSIDMTLAETHSASEYENFSLSAFKSGTLGGF